jgi:uncharacterized membrane protein YdcZ (DUF606 family)
MMGGMTNPTGTPEGPRRRREAPWWALALGLVAIMSALSSTRHMSLLGAVLVLAGVFGGLSVAGWRWGADSRDGSDWKPRKPGAIR